MPDGRIEPRQTDVLHQVGAWMDQNSESIYGTRGGPWKPTKAVASTRRGNTIYLHILQWKSDEVELPDVAHKVKAASLFNGGKVKIVKRDGQLVITVPAAARDALDTVVKLQLDGSAMDLPAWEVSPKIKATASNVFQNQTAEYGPEFAVDGDVDTRWATDDGTGQAWIAVDLGRAQAVRRVRIHEAYAGRVQNYELQYQDGTAWNTFLTGATLGADCELTFPVVRASKFRLNILSAKQDPTIGEIEFLSN
jgi:alpha-L-fucosidase